MSLPFAASGRSAFHGVMCVRCGGHASMVQWWAPYCGVCLAQIAAANGGKYPAKEPASVRENPTKLTTKISRGRCQTSFDKKDMTFFVTPDKST